MSVLVVHGAAGELSARLEDAGEGVAATAATTVAAGLERFDEGDFDCVVGGGAFADDDGIALLETIRERDAGLPYVLYTADGSEELASRAISAGVSDYLSVADETDRIAELAERIANLVETHRRGTVSVGADGERGPVDHAPIETESGTLIAGERFVDDLFDALEDLFYVLDDEGSIVRVNDRVIERTGYDRSELLSMHASDIIAADGRDRLEGAIAETIETGESTVELAVLTAEGDEITHEFRTRRLVDGAGAVVGLVGIGRDVSDRKHRERQFKRQAEQFEAFGSVLSHDLRNPLNVVTGRSELLRDDHENGREHMVEQHVDAIERAAGRLEEIIDDLSGVMKEGELVNDVRPVELEGAVREAWDPLEPSGATLSVADSREIMADRRALTRMLDNLLGNAVEHGGEGATVTVGTLSNGFFVADDGPGIPPEDRDAVFKPGYTTKESGSGFGLASAHQIALAHGWEIDVTESEGGGTRFEIVDVRATR